MRNRLVTTLHEPKGFSFSVIAEISTTEVSKEEFKKWIQSSKRKTKAFTEYKGIKNINDEDNPIFYSEREYIRQKVDDVFNSRSNKLQTRDDWEYSDESINAENDASDSYSDYVKSLSENSTLQNLYDGASIGERIRIREGIETAGYEVDDLIDTSKEKVEAKQRRDAKKKKQSEELMKKLGISPNEGEKENLRFHEKDSYTEEEQSIAEKANKNGSFMKAPNGKKTNLTETPASLLEKGSETAVNSPELIPNTKSKQQNGAIKKARYELMEAKRELSVAEAKNSGYTLEEVEAKREKVKGVENTLRGLTDNNSSGNDIRFREEKDDASKFATKHGIDETDVRKYVESMHLGNLGGASFAFQEIRRKKRTENTTDSLRQFSQRFSPIMKELYETFGNVEKLREEAVRVTMEERNAMESARKRIEAEEETERVRLQEFQDMSIKQLDGEYLKSIEDNDENRMRDLVNEAARRNGYDSDADFRMSHRAPSYDEEGIDKSMIDIANNKDEIRESLNEQLRMNRDEAKEESAASINEVLTAIDNGEKATVTIYRSVPKALKEGNVRNGDWVTLSEAYANIHGEHALHGDYRIMKEEVPAENIYWDGNDINEWGYDDRSDYRYKNIKNNRKLNDLITRDDKGDVIPLSKRFNSQKHDPRFREMDDVGEPVLKWDSTSEELNDEEADSYEAENYGRLTINNVNQEIYDISGPHLSKLYKNGSLGRVLVGDHAGINQIKAYREYNSARENLDPLRKKLEDMIPRCTDAARKEVENTISDIDYALDYYKRLYEGEDVWRSAARPRFRILDEQSNTSTEEEGEVVAKVGELVESLHTPVCIARTIADVSDGAAKRAIEKGRNIKGWYDPNTGEVVVYLPNTDSATDAQATILHEVVAHKGLKEMLGEESFNELCGKVFDTLPEDVRYGLLEKHEDRLIAGDEYMASIAENGCNTTLWEKIKGFIRDAFRKIGVDLSISDGDIKYLLWKSKNRLMRGGNGMNMVQKIAADADMRESLGIGESGHKPEVIRFRDEMDSKPSDGTIEEYEAELKKKAFKAKEAYQDSMLALKKMQDIIAQKSDKELKSFENAYTAENHLSSKNTAEVESYGKHFFRPIMEEIGNLINNGNSYDDVKRYVFAKHGLERNEVFARRDASNAVIEKFWKKKNVVQRKYDEGKLSKDEYEKELQELQLAEKDLYEQQYEENRQRDYSGLTTLTEDKENYEELAQDIIDEFERSNDVSGLWQAINSATKETLKKTYESGLINKATYEKVSGQFRYYIPLRGWNEETAADVYEYLQSEVSPVNAAMKTAKGRMSLADDPFATIGNMAESNIFIGNRNLMKQRFMNMVLNHPSDVVSLSEAWYVKDSYTGDWVLSTPDIRACLNFPQ